MTKTELEDDMSLSFLWLLFFLGQCFSQTPSASVLAGVFFILLLLVMKIKRRNMSDDDGSDDDDDDGCICDESI